MARGRPLEPLTLTSEERTTLTRWTRRPTTAQALAPRARLVLAAAEGRSNKDVAAALEITEPTVGKWRRRFLVQRLDGLLDKPRPGAPRTIGDADVERVIALTLESAPRDATHWSTRSMATLTGFSQSSISRIWRAFALARGIGACGSSSCRVRASRQRPRTGGRPGLRHRCASFEP